MPEDEIIFKKKLIYADEIKKKDPESYSNRIIDSLNHIEIPFTKPLQIVGSYPYISQLYNDIDGRQTVLFCENKEEAVTKIVKLLKKMAHNINDTTNIFWSNLKAGFHNNKEVKWTIEEVMRGFIVFPNRDVLYLKDAIQQPGIVNIEIWRFINDRFVEISNFYRLRYCDKQGKVQIINNIKDDFKEAMKKDIKVLLKEGNYYKALKRVFVLGVRKNDKKIVLSVQKLLLSFDAKIYQLSVDIHTIIEMLTILKNPPMKKILSGIDIIKDKLGKFYYNSNTDNMFLLFNNLTRNRHDIKTIIKVLFNIFKFLSKDINASVLKFIKEEDLFNKLKKNNYID